MSLIDEKHVLWIRNTKCGGTSLKVALSRPDRDKNPNLHSIQFIKSGKFYSEVPKLSKVTCLISWEVPKFRKRYPDIWNNSFRFIVSRNPYDRWVSGWRYCESTKKRSFENVIKKPPKSGHDYKHLVRQQTASLVVDGEFQIDHMIRFENYAEEFAEFCHIVGLPDNLELPHIRKTKHQEYTKYFTDETREIFEPMFSDDLKFLEYTY